MSKEFFQQTDINGCEEKAHSPQNFLNFAGFDSCQKIQGALVLKFLKMMHEKVIKLFASCQPILKGIY